MCRLIALASLMALPFWATAADDKSKPETIELGGLRQARAVLTVSEDEYTIKVRMLPVRCFDEPTNARLNREKCGNWHCWPWRSISPASRTSG